ncbi:hypothetical protein [Actinophytocola glycyrrhizae]|uniref:Uncharacterized protein n=1 Tax=Actinophytocola glycyrrhizae TaxID=2044873 RepID=A0ABV9S2Z0_9PSEU
MTPPFTVTVLGQDAALAVAEEVTPHDGGRFAVRLTVTARAAGAAGLRVSLRLGRTDDPGWLVPGVFYGENRVTGCRVRYPRFTVADPDPAALESDAWSFRADRCATPAVFGWDAAGGAALVTTEWSPLGQAGVGFAVDDGHPVLRLHFPYREEPVVYDGSPTPRPADVPSYPWEAGETVTIDFDVYVLGPDRHSYSEVLRDVHRRTAARDLDTVPWVSLTEAADLTAWGLYRWHYRDEDAVLLETAAFDRDALGERGDRQAMHVAWLSGVPHAYALLRHGRRVGNRSYVDAACAVLDNITANLTPGGTFWGQWTRENGWNAGWTPNRRRVHARTLGEATVFLQRAVALGAAPALWVTAVRSNLDVACASQDADGALGSGYDVETGAVIDRFGTSGLAWIPALVSAGRVAVAQRAGRYYAQAVREEFLYGAPEDVDLAPTSEDGYLAIMAYVALYEADGDREWLDLACRAADWTLTFRYTYDVDFPPHTLLGHYDFRSRGADQASPANQHLHSYGLICHRELTRLGEHTGDEYYTRSAAETLACFRQFVAREDGDFNAYRGMVTERYFQTACYQPKGMLLTLSHAWCVGVLLLACEESL